MTYYIYEKINDLFRQGVASPLFLIFIGILGLVTIGGMVANSLSSTPEVNIRTTPQKGIVPSGESFDVQLIVSSSIPVNAF